MTGRAAQAAARSTVAVGLLGALASAGVLVVGSLRASDWSDPGLGAHLVEPWALATTVVGLLWWSTTAVVRCRRATGRPPTVVGRSPAAPRGGELLGPIAVLPIATVAVGALAASWAAGVMFLPVAASLALWWVVEVLSAMADVDRWCRDVLEPRPPTPVHDRVEDPRRSHHTVIPRAMVLAAHVALLSVPLWLVVLERSGRASVDGWHVTLDLEAQRLLTAIGVVAGTTHALGWTWWTVAAALNASRRVRWPVSPFLAPLAHLVGVGAGVSVLWSLELVAPERRVALVAVGAAVALLAHLAVLGGYRRTAAALGAGVRHWTWAITSPWLAVTLTAAAAFATADAGSGATEFVLEAGWVLCYFVHAVTVHAAMATFDRECAGRRQVRVTDRAVTSFIATLRPSPGPTAHPES